MHQSVVANPRAYFSRFPEIVLQVEEPLAEAGMLLLFDLSAAVARHVKVVLTGQGADEPLGGYVRHQASRLALILARVPGLGGASRFGSANEKVARFLHVLRADPGPGRAAAPFSSLSPEACGSLVRGCGPEAGRVAILAGVDRWWRRSEGMDDLGRMLYVDVRTSLADDLLLMGDKTAMAHGLEARVPLLDLEYLSFLESIPGPSRIPLWRRRKWIQHGLARRMLPPGLVEALKGSNNPFGKKLGFEVPVDAWLRRGFGSRLVDVIAGPKSMLPEYIDRAYLTRTVGQYLDDPRQSYRTVLGLYVLEIWFRGMVADLPVAELPAA